MSSGLMMKSVQEIHEHLADFRNRRKNFFATTSLQSHSIPLLHILAKCEVQVPIFFINTGFLFPETIKFRDEIQTTLNIQITTLEPTIPKIQQQNNQGNFYFTDDPDRCCFLNKIDPVDRLLPQFDIWISGVRKDQTINRESMEYLEPGKEGCWRFHPMLNWTRENIADYINEYSLPKHPLEAQGYTSIGCQPCTSKTNDRQGRWAGLRKTECGLHLNSHASKSEGGT